MESYDISNTGASDIVASMVVYEGAKPKKSAYRRFKIKSLSAHPDDYASMEEVLTRRIQRYLDGDEKFSPLPDVMLIDGGITHAGVAERVCAQMHVHIPIFGMVKDDRHRTRALVTAEGREIDLHAAPNVFALIGQIQEAYWFFTMRLSVASTVFGMENSLLAYSVIAPSAFTFSFVTCRKYFSRSERDALCMCFWNMSRSLPTSIPLVCMKSVSGSLTALIRSAWLTRYSLTNLLPGVSATPLEVTKASSPPSLSSSIALTKK